MLDRTFAFIAPHPCSGCAEIGSILCDNCKNDIVNDPFERCLVCLKPTATMSLCKPCAKSSGIDGAWCIGERSGSLQCLLDAYKFRSAKAASKPISDLLDRTLPVYDSDFTVVPVPTASSHIRSRGFDHTYLFAKQFAKCRGLKIQRVMNRSSHSSQHFRTRKERLLHAADGLSITKNVPEVILLIDDIYTTGATIGACVSLLRKNGAKQVFVAVVSRKVLDDRTDLW